MFEGTTKTSTACLTSALSANEVRNGFFLFVFFRAIIAFRTVFISQSFDGAHSMVK